MKRLSCFAIAAITALWGGTAAGYAGIEHGWLAMMSGNVWQDFDPAFYDTLTRVFEPLTLTAHRQYMIRKFYAIGCMLPDMFTREGWKASRGIVRDLYPWRGVLPDPLSISGGTYEQVQDSIVWKDPEPNQNLPALEEMALYARAQNWSAYEKALVYGAYAHVAMDLQAGVIQLPSLWGSDFVADPPEAVGPPGIDILRTA
ncbi:hypothetical protein FJY71_09825, partial [candidate division WOR-3 bacterium]|nr:hypothetical protein [candidate division WOR-3 bacterium]